MQPPPPPLDAALVRAFVTAAHSDLARVTAMLGRLEVVRAAVAADPAVVTVEGPHGISLLRHAQAGKQEAVVMYLTSVGGA